MKARFGDGFYIGHALASYTLQEHLDDDLKDEDEAQSPDGSRISWKTIIDEAISSTRITFPEVIPFIYAYSF